MEILTSPITSGVLGLVGLLFAALTYIEVVAKPSGNAMVFLKREYAILFIIAVALTVAFFLPYGPQASVAFIAGSLFIWSGDEYPHQAYVNRIAGHCAAPRRWVL